jgi:heterotetrameric sarcosine oxidase delta subunit
MIRIPCPHCGPRNSQEFRYSGEPHPRPVGDGVTPAEFRRYLYERTNALGWVSENWFHTAGCRRFIRIERHTLTNECRPVGFGNTNEEAAP